MSYAPRRTTSPMNFSSSSAAGSPFQRSRLRSSASSMSGGAGGLGSRISMPTFTGLSNKLRSNSLQNLGTLVPRADDKETMKCLNDRLADYLSRVRLLEETNSKLETQIKEILLKRGTVSERDWSAYERPLIDLRKQIREMTMANARLLLQIDNARLAADDFKVKFESEQAIRQSVEQDIAGLRKIIDDTNMSRIQLTGQIESLKEELVFIKKSHQDEVAGLRAQISDSNVTVEMNASKGPEITETIAKIRTQYEKVAQKSNEDTETWYQNKLDDLTATVNLNTDELQKVKNELSSLCKRKQTLEIELQTQLNMNQSLEDALNNAEERAAHHVGELNERIRCLEAELGQMRAQVERQAADYQALLNTKMKLEKEISQYRQLLEGIGNESDTE